MKLKVNYQISKKTHGISSSVQPIQRWKDFGDKKRKEKKMILKKQRLISQQNFLMKTENDNQIALFYDGDEQETDSQVSSSLIIKEISSGQEYSITLFCGMQVSPDGIVKLTFQMNHFNFGLNQEGNQKKIRLLMNLGIVDVQRETDFNMDIIRNVKEERLAKAQAFQILNKKPDSVNMFIMNRIQYVVELLEERERLSGPAPHHFREGFMELKNIEYQEFIDECFEYFRNLPSNQMYQYNIGRSHPITDQADVLHSGYSQEYLDLLGIDSTALTSLFLRKKTIDLVQNARDINKLSANILTWMKDCRFNVFYDYEEYKEASRRKNAKEFVSEPVSCKIRTFDGFELNLSQKVKGVYFPMNYYYNAGRLVDCSCGLFMQIFELDVDLHELEALIAYRVRLQEQSSQLSLDDYLQRELSLMFEDVEYSVRSQEFLDKYYTNTLPSLRQIQLTKEEILQQESIRCKYRKLY